MDINKWKEVKWGDIAELKYGKALKGYKDKKSGIRVFGTNGPIGYTEQALAKGPTVVVGRKGAYRGVHYSKKDFYVIDTAYYLVPKTELNLRWAYYDLLLKDINSLDSGSAIPSTSREDVYAIKTMIPPLKVQNQIAYILSLFDEKINTNLKVISSLEKISQTLFKRWFIDFEFPNNKGEPYKSSGGVMKESELGEIPDSWTVDALGQYIELEKGISYKGAYLDKNREREDSIPLITIANFNFYAGFKNAKTKYYFGDYKEKHLLKENDIVIAATDLTQDRKMLGAPAIVPKLNNKMIFSLDVFRIIKASLPKYYLYYLLQTPRYRNVIGGSATGTTVLRVSKMILQSYRIPSPGTMELLELFNSKIEPMMTEIIELEEENKKLQQLRDTLLPKLLSGEIDIPDDLEVE